MLRYDFGKVPRVIASDYRTPLCVSAHRLCVVWQCGSTPNAYFLGIFY